MQVNVAPNIKVSMARRGPAALTGGVVSFLDRPAVHVNWTEDEDVRPFICSEHGVLCMDLGFMFATKIDTCCSQCPIAKITHFQ